MENFTVACTFYVYLRVEYHVFAVHQNLFMYIVLLVVTTVYP